MWTNNNNQDRIYITIQTKQFTAYLSWAYSTRIKREHDHMFVVKRCWHAYWLWPKLIASKYSINKIIVYKSIQIQTTTFAVTIEKWLYYGPFPRHLSKDWYCNIAYIKICICANCDGNSSLLTIIVNK